MTEEPGDPADPATAVDHELRGSLPIVGEDAWPTGPAASRGCSESLERESIGQGGGHRGIAGTRDRDRDRDRHLLAPFPTTG